MSNSPFFAAVIGFAPGATGGICNVVVGYPIDLVKVRMQTMAVSPQAATAISAAAAPARNVVSRSGTFQTLRNIFVNEGIPGLYRGVSAPLLAVTPAFAISFWSYDIGKTVIRRLTMERELSDFHLLLAGAWSGIPLAAVLGPSERIKCLMQVQTGGTAKYSSMADCARQLYREGGVRSIYKGSFATVLREVPGCAAYFGTYEFFRREISRAQGLDPNRGQFSFNATLLAGGLAGVTNWIVAIPFDTIKSRFQTAPPGKYVGLHDVFTQLMEKEGAHALFRGLSPALIRAFPANAACLAGAEAARSALNVQ